MPPIPRTIVTDVLAGVPQLLKNVVPPNILGQISQFARNAIEVIVELAGKLIISADMINYRHRIEDVNNEWELLLQIQ